MTNFRPAFTSDIAKIVLIGDGVASNLWRFIENAFVAEKDGDVVGVAIAIPENGVHYLSSVAVKPSFRGIGLATLLIQYIREAVETPLVAIVKPERESFYAQLGFTPAGRVMEMA